MTSKYDALGEHLAAVGADAITLSFAESEAVVGPTSAPARSPSGGWRDEALPRAILALCAGLPRGRRRRGGGVAPARTRLARRDHRGARRRGARADPGPAARGLSPPLTGAGRPAIAHARYGFLAGGCFTGAASGGSSGSLKGATAAPFG